MIAVNAAAFVDLGRPSCHTILDRLTPDEIAVAADNRVRGTVFVCLLRKEGGVNAAKDYPRSALPGQTPDFVAAPRVARVNADPHDVARGNRVGVDLIECFIDQDGVAPT